MIWKIEFYSIKVRDNIQKWPINLKAKFTKIVDLLKEFGPDEVGMPFVKSLKKGLFEIRAKSNEGLGRAFFCNLYGKRIKILHEIIKKTEKTPKNDLELARKRMKEVENNE